MDEPTDIPKSEAQQPRKRSWLVTVVVAILSTGLVLVIAAGIGFVWLCSQVTPVSPEESKRIMEQARKSPADPDRELQKELAQPAAQQLMSQAFLWDSFDENAPFGNDDGADTLSFWRKWRREHQDTDPEVFVKEILEKYGVSYADWSAKEGEALPTGFVAILATNMGDNTIIAIAFGQLIDEGYIDESLLKLAQKAVSNEQQPLMYDRWRDKTARQERLAILKSILDKAPKHPSK